MVKDDMQHKSRSQGRGIQVFLNFVHISEFCSLCRTAELQPLQLEDSSAFAVRSMKLKLDTSFRLHLFIVYRKRSLPNLIS